MRAWTTLSLRRPPGSAAEGSLAPQSEVSPCVIPGLSTTLSTTCTQPRRLSPSPSLYRRTVDSNGLSIRCATQAESRPTSERAAQPILARQRRLCAATRIPVADAASPVGPGTGADQRLRWSVPCGAPRRNRTADPILTMNPGSSAVRSTVSAGRCGPLRAKLCAQSSGLLGAAIQRDRVRRCEGRRAGRRSPAPCSGGVRDGAAPSIAAPRSDSPTRCADRLPGPPRSCTCEGAAPGPGA